MIPEGAFVHESVERKIREDPEYHPVNMPARYQVIAMPERPPAYASGAGSDDEAG